MQRNPALTVDAVVFDRLNRLLLIKRKNPPFAGQYALPGGFVDFGETVEAATRRELFEETGVTGSSLQLVGVYSDPKRDPRGHTVSVVFLMSIDTAQPEAGDDAAAAEFVASWQNLELAFDHSQIAADAWRIRCSTTHGQIIRERTPADDAAIAALVADAFAGPSEAALVDGLRQDGDLTLELLCEEQGRVTGHIAISRLAATSSAATLKAVALAPLAVSPKKQRLGTGSALIYAGLSRLKLQGTDLVVVLGHPNYYERFGFSSSLAQLLDAPYSGPSFMALDLVPGVLAAQRWTVTYPKAFSG